MPIIIETDTVLDSVELADVIDYMYEAKIDTRDESAMVAAGPMLRRLGNNRTFLADMALAELKERSRIGALTNRYGPQVMMLYPPKGDQQFFMRANFWPSENDHLLKSSGPEQFFYHYPHDHSFNFLTVGYFGPGYRSNYYEYDYEAAAGFPGEKVALKFIENAALHEGKTMLYRACVDIHDQLPSESMSISLNIMESSMRGAVLDQYTFDVENQTVGEMINRVPSAVLMPLVAAADYENGRDYLVETARTHVKERVRFAALKALASSAGDRESYVAAFQTGTRNDSVMVAGWCGHELSRLAQVA